MAGGSPDNKSPLPAGGADPNRPDRPSRRFRLFGHVWPYRITRSPAVVTVTALVLGAGLALGAIGTGSAQAQDHSGTDDGALAEPADPERDALLREGAAVYRAVCSSCHQPGGVGRIGEYPPLLDNPRTDDPTDAEYVTLVINTGRSGALEVDGVTYDGTMASFGTLPDDDIAAVVAYVTSGFQAPSLPVADTDDGSQAVSLPLLATMSVSAALAIAAAVAALVLAPLVIGRIDRTDTSWVQAWLKTAVISIAAILVAAFIPNWVLQTRALASLNRTMQDLIAAGLWGGGMLAIAWGLWYAHRDGRI